MISKIIKSISKLSNEYIDITVSQPYQAIKKSYGKKPHTLANKFSIASYIKKQKQMTSPEIRNTAYVNNCELRKTYIRDFNSRNTMH
jgi:hypothetical protein